ncbi:ABC transporter substrate-binding protein [Paramagnetospirillum kuznetsovii]|uniref:ABC transporter substrate-binding protein n=1 Tax=Paramagnetospirillum kuznetsovii TaxID=2053833 RepID=A0A364NYX0_9PROT|nr:ABC transporter substrate-binding protein [Paramagnetospirillum kuznetsovii]RAU22278.1 ABC transporter substrate-binding protein [Paramagnetospirillum kuznetsovii]
MTSRRPLLAALLIALTAMAIWPSGAWSAEPKPKPYRIYMALWRGWEEAAQGFKDYFTNQNIPVELIIRDAGQDKSKLKDFVAEAKRLEVDLVFTWGTTVSEEMLGRLDTVAADKHITEIPAVFAIVSQPLGSMVKDFASSGRNITGTTYLVPTETQANLIQSYRPFKRLGVVFNPLERNAQVAIGEFSEVGAKAGFEVISRSVDLVDGKPNPASIPAKVAELKKAKVDFLYIPPDTFLNVNRDILTGAALEQGIPTFAAGENPVLTSKAMFGGVYRYYTVGQLTAYKAEQILVHKIKPAEIPIDAPKRLSIIINMPVVRQLGLYPPMKLLGLAEVIDPTEGKGK